MVLNSSLLELPTIVVRAIAVSIIISSDKLKQQN